VRRRATLIGAWLALFSTFALANSNGGHRTIATTTTAHRSCLQLLDGATPDWPVYLNLQSADAKGVAAPPSRSREEFTNARGQTTVRYSWQWPPEQSDAITATWTVVSAADSVAGVQVVSGDARGPVELWVFDGECALRDRRRRVYEHSQDPQSSAGQAVANASSTAVAVLVLDTETGAMRNVDALNPAVPPLDAMPSAAMQSQPNNATPDQLPPVRVALVDSGVNYLLPVINQRLARHADGSLVGYDFWDQDERPFDAHLARSAFHVSRHGTRTASVLLREAPFVELVPYRYPRPDMSRMRDLIEHAVNNDVSIIGMPLGGNKAEEWQVFKSAAQAHPQVLFIASAGNNGRDIDQQPVYPASIYLDNMLVVTSADDFARPAEGVNWGYEHVDYLLPAENVPVLDFAGALVPASGSSYAVPRLVALAAYLQQQNPTWRAPELIAAIARRFADGTSVRHVNDGYIADPLSVALVDAKQDADAASIAVNTERVLDLSAGESVSAAVPIDVLILDDRWLDERIDSALRRAERILNQCQLTLSDVRIKRIAAPDYLRDLSTGPARTLMDAARASGPARRLTLVFARDTRMQTPFDGEAFGRGNTRNRPWMQDSVWLTLPIVDEGLALAHEMFHVLVNSGEHVDIAGNLMQARTQGDNTALDESQCAQAHEQALRNNLAHVIATD